MFSAAFKAFSSGITANYSVSKHAQFRAGPWSVYGGKKKSTNEPVSVFVFDKKALASMVTKNGLPKSSLDEFYDRLRREVNALSKIRHPSIVRIIEPLEDGRAAMTFITEPLNTCLKATLDLNSSGSNRDGTLDELEIQKGLLQITEGLVFLHNTAGQVHLDIQPSSILIDIKGDWKLGGFGFIKSFKDSTQEYFIAQYDPRLPPFLQPNLDFSAPELVLDRRLDPSNDVFSLGCLILSIYILKPPMRTDNNSSTYRSELGNLQRELRSNKIPDYLKNTLHRLLARTPMERISLEDLKQSEFFDNPLIRTINFLDDFPAKLVSEKKTFLSGLKQMLPQFPKSVLQRKILQSLVADIGREESLVYLILQNVLTIGQDMSQLSFSEKILPHLDQVKDQFGCQTAVLDFLPVLLSRLNTTEFKEHILPILLKMLETAPPENQAQALTKTGDIMQKLDFVTLKNELFPQIANVFGKTTSLSVKLEALKAFRVLIGTPGETQGGLDKYAITEKLIPLLGGMKTREPKIIMTALDVYSSIVNMVDIEVLARSIVPHLLLLSMESLLTKSQFHDFLARIKSIIDKIEQDHGKKLSDTAPQSAMNPQQRPQQPLQQNSTSEDNFESLIYGRPSVSSDNSIPTSTSTGPMRLGSLTPQPTSPTGAAGSSTLQSLQSLQPLQPQSPVQSQPLSQLQSQPLQPQRQTSSFAPLTPTSFNTSNNNNRSMSLTSSNSVDWSKVRSSVQAQAQNQVKPGFGGTSIPTLPKPSSTSTTPSTATATATQQKKGNLDQYQSLL